MRFGTKGLISPKAAASLVMQSPLGAVNTARDMVLGQKNINFPRRILLMLTDRCNFKCPMCSIGEAMESRGAKDMPFEMIERVLSEARRYSPMIELLGGEPTLYPRLIDTISLISKYHMASFIVTNGLRIEKMAPDLVSAGLSVLQVSLDGWDEESQYLRGKVPGSFEKIMNGIAAVKERRGAKTLPLIRIITTITKNNYRDLDKIQKMLHARGIEEWYISNYFFVRDDILNRHFKFKSETGIGGYVAADAVGSGTYFDADEVAELERTLERVRKNNEKMGMRMSFNSSVDLKDYYSEKSPGPSSKCSLPYTRVEIQTDGRVSTCIDNYTFGDLKDGSIFELWNSDKKQYLHGTMEKVWPMPMCFRCCGLADTIAFDASDSGAADSGSAERELETVSLL